jgi:hypothetical protein
MAYCTVEDMRRILPEKVTIGDQNIGRPTPGRPTTQRSNISPDEAREYINYSTMYIDSRLRPYYSCPLRRIKTYETPIKATFGTGTDVDITVHDSNSFIINMRVIIQDKYTREETYVAGVPDFTTVTVASVTQTYDFETVRISIVEYPDPIVTIAARLACSFLLDRLYTSEQSPDVSNYGKTQRNIARNAIDDILAGEVLLFGQEHTGYRFARGSIFDAFKSPAATDRGEERE